MKNVSSWSEKRKCRDGRRVRRHHLCRRQAPFHGFSGATRPQIICPQRHRATIHHIRPWRVTELYGAHGVEVGGEAAKIVPAGSDTVEVQRRRMRRHGLLSATGGLARRFCGDASADGMLATSSRDQSPCNTMARHQTLRRALASASAQMPRSWRDGDGVRYHGVLSLCGLSLRRSRGLLTQQS